MDMTNNAIPADAEIEGVPAEAEMQPIDESVDTSPRLVITGETILYVVIFVLALVLRLPNLGTFPLTASESHEALAAYRAVIPEAAGNPITPSQPLMFTFNAIALTIGGADNATPRLVTVILGALIVLMPLLLRRWIGVTRALLLSSLLAISPVLFIASRSMSGAVWSLALVLISIWLTARFIETARAPFAIAATIAVAFLVLMAEPAGFVIAFGLVVGIAFAVYTTEDSDGVLRNTISEARRAWPATQAFPIAALALIVVGTVFLIHPSGLAGIGELIGRGLGGIFRRPDGLSPAYPLLISLVYEPVLWLFGVLGVYFIAHDDLEASNGVARFIGRLLIGWLLFSVVAGLVYAGAGADHALWFTLPLAGLSMFALEKVFSPIRDFFWNPPAWGSYLHAVGVVAILAIMTINLMMFGTTVIGLDMTIFAPSVTGQGLDLFLIGLVIGLTLIGFVLVNAIWGPRNAPLILILGGAITLFLVARAVVPLLTPEFMQQMNVQSWFRLVFVLLSSALLVITYFLIGSTWGPGTAWRGLGLGSFLFLAAFSLSAGWRTAVLNADNPADLWHVNVAGRNLNLIENTLREASLRSVGTPYDMDITVQIPTAEADDTPVAWIVRRYKKTRFQTEMNESVTTRAAIAFKTDPQPTLGGTYVGQAFSAAFTWDRSTMLLWDVIPWLYDRQVRYQPTASQPMILYLRSDVYGLDPSTTFPATGGEQPSSQPARP